MFSQYFQNVCLIFSQYLHNIYSILEQYMPDICPILSQYFQNICLTFEMSKILKNPKILKITTKCSTNLKNPKNLKIYKNLNNIKNLKKYQTKKISKIPKKLFVFSDIYLINRKSKCVQFCSSLSPICTNCVLVFWWNLIVCASVSSKTQ